jgi:hypothetical protein
LLKPLLSRIKSYFGAKRTGRVGDGVKERHGDGEIETTSKVSFASLRLCGIVLEILPE